MTRVRERHPCNTDFRWALPDREPTTTTAGQRAQFDRSGFLEVVLGGDLVPLF